MRRVNRRKHRTRPRDLAAQIWREFPHEPHEALKRMRQIPGSDAIPDTYWRSVEREISALSMRQRHAAKSPSMCSCRASGRRECSEHGDDT